MDDKEKFLSGKPFRFAGTYYKYEEGINIINEQDCYGNWHFQSTVQRVTDQSFYCFNHLFGKSVTNEVPFSSIRFENPF